MAKERIVFLDGGGRNTYRRSDIHDFFEQFDAMKKFLKENEKKDDKDGKHSLTLFEQAFAIALAMYFGGACVLFSYSLWHNPIPI